MKTTFKPKQNNQKQHVRNVIWLTNHLLAQAERKTLFKEENPLGELHPDGTVKNYTKDKFYLPGSVKNTKRFSWKSVTRAVQIQSPGDGAYAFVIKTGRDIQVKVFCNRLEDKNYQCESTFFQAEEKLGDILFSVNPSLVDHE